VNPNTVQRAYDELAREGLFHARRGKGLFVADQGAADARTGAKQEVRQWFDQGVRAGHAAGLSVKVLRSVFEMSLQGRGETGN
jgi:DNA-binding transcriptional regulator YhcF (GntR family)